MLLGIHVTKTLRAKRKLVRRYARLMGSSTMNLLATERMVVAARVKADFFGVRGFGGAEDVTEEKYWFAADCISDVGSSKETCAGSRV